MAGTLPLRPPPPDFATRTLDIASVSPATLCRVSKYDTNEPHFARSGACRFDDPAERFGTCYLGFNLTVAFAESVLHDLEPGLAGFSVPTSEITRRFALRFKASGASPVLQLAKMYGTALLRLGGNGELSGTAVYDLPQSWSAALYDHPAKIDGFIYMSRRVSDSMAVVLFERTPSGRTHLVLDQAVRLHHHVDFRTAIDELGVTLT